ncbi:MAG: hypothetical protein OES38_20860, partial [Gammaproteobacteria bacterium]|nr:hypothetical protein [Gammaproteobacteria bacterium]
MTIARRVTGIARSHVLVALICVAVVILLAPLLSRVTLPVVDTVELFGEEIYQLVDSTRRIPATVALPYLARAGGSRFVRSLPLEVAVRDRVLARLDSPGFVHEIVPLVLAVKSMYVAPDEKRADNFDRHLRRSFSRGEDLPGFEHSMFSWNPDAGADDQTVDTGLALTPELAAELIGFYDALYLDGRDPTAGLDERLACGPSEIEGRLAETAARSGPALRRLLMRVRDGMEPNSELADAVSDVLDDDKAFETIGISLVHFVELTVCKQYRMFASRVTRQEQLEGWLAAELDRDQGGRIWSYLQAAQDTRRYGALIVVDGLQGHLIEALARGDSRNPFLQRVREEQKSGAQRVASGPPLEHDLQQNNLFLDRLSSEGFTHAAYLPFFRDLYADAGSDDRLRPWGIAVGGISTTPTISVRNLPVVKTGAPVAGAGATGVPNFHFVDRHYQRDGVRQGRAFYFFGNDALQLTALTAQAGMQSLFERLSDRGSYSCGAQYDEWAQDGIDPFFNLALGEAVRDFGEILCFRELERRADNEVRLRQYREELLALRDRLGASVPFYDWYRMWGARAAQTRAEQLIERIAELEVQALPELLVYYNPWPDHFAHFAGPFSDEVIAPSGELAR